jgi:cardiolipin synthase (CMP-forming)
MTGMADATSTPAEAGEDRILTVPNLITLVRLLCIPVFLWLLWGLDAPAWAALLLAFLGATDWVDGYVARHFHQVSTLGKAFDPIVDRALLIIGVLSIIAYGAVPLWLGLVVVIREVILSAWVVGITALGAKRMDVTWWGKAGTFGMMVAFPAFLASSDTALPDGVRTALEVIAWGAAIPGLVCSMIAFAGYFPMGLDALREGREGRAAAANGV